MSLLEQINQLVINLLSTDHPNFIAKELGIDPLEIAKANRKYLKQVSTPSPTIDIPLQKKTCKANIRKQTTGPNKCRYKNRDGKRCTTTVRGNGKYCSKHR